MCTEKKISKEMFTFYVMSVYIWKFTRQNSFGLQNVCDSKSFSTGKIFVVAKSRWERDWIKSEMDGSRTCLAK